MQKNKSSDRWDLCLSDGTKFFVDQEKYKSYLESSPAVLQKPTAEVGTDANEEAIHWCTVCSTALSADSTLTAMTIVQVMRSGQILKDWPKQA